MDKDLERIKERQSNQAWYLFNIHSTSQDGGCSTFIGALAVIGS